MIGLVDALRDILLVLNAETTACDYGPASFGNLE